jgi:Tfp pilus assembly protein PilN
MRSLHIDFGPKQRSRIWYGGCALLVAGLALLGSVAWRYATYAQIRGGLQAEHDRLLHLSNQPMADMKALVNPLPKERIGPIVQAMGRLNAPWDALLADIESAMDERVALLGLEPDLVRKEVQLRGEAKDIDSVFDFVRRIDATAALDAVHLDHHWVNRQDLQRPVQFVLVARWSMAEPGAIGRAEPEGGLDPASGEAVP